jgi:hypothetical protein
MSPVLRREAWPDPAPGSCAYLCGPFALDAHRAASSDASAKARDSAIARAALADQLRDVGHTLLEGATLYAPAGVSDPWEAQYVRANVEPWDLADLPLPGADAVRLEANETGLGNLALAGTWVRTLLNITSVEGAVASGIAAARALGCATQPILGEALLRRVQASVLLAGREEVMADARRRSAKDWPATEWFAGV